MTDLDRHADVIVVGGGSAGAALAARLSEDPDRTVLLVEAGAAGPLPSEADLLGGVSFALTTRDWGMRAHARPDRSLDYPQGRFLGGGSSVNGALAFRGSPADYDGWAATGCPSWSWEHLLPCFRRLERDLDLGDADPDVHGNEGPVPIVRWPADSFLPIQEALRDGLLAQGLPWTDDHNAPGSTGVGSFPMNRLDGRRMSTALTYLAEARSRPNLSVLADTQVDRIRLAGGRAVGVVGRGPAGPVELGGDEVVLSAGAISSPALLWRSGIGPAGDLDALGIEVVVDLPAVGANVTDHPGAFLFCAPGERQVAAPDPQYQLGARYTATGSEVADDMFMGMMNYWDLAGSPDFQAHLGVPRVVVLTCGVHQPRSRGRVSLASADPTVPPRIDLNLLDDRADLVRMRDGLRRALDVARSPGMAPFLGGVLLLDEASIASDDALDAYLRQVVAPWYHPVGTCRMGPDDRAGTVVDEQLRVHGVDGLRVVDASIMPAITRAPTNLTAIAIAERAIELMARPARQVR